MPRSPHVNIPRHRRLFDGSPENKTQNGRQGRHKVGRKAYIAGRPGVFQQACVIRWMFNYSHNPLHLLFADAAGAKWRGRLLGNFVGQGPAPTSSPPQPRLGPPGAFKGGAPSRSRVFHGTVPNHGGRSFRFPEVGDESPSGHGAPPPDGAPPMKGTGTHRVFGQFWAPGGAWGLCRQKAKPSGPRPQGPSTKTRPAGQARPANALPEREDFFRPPCPQSKQQKTKERLPPIGPADAGTPGAAGKIACDKREGPSQTAGPSHAWPRKGPCNPLQGKLKLENYNEPPPGIGLYPPSGNPLGPAGRLLMKRAIAGGKAEKQVFPSAGPDLGEKYRAIPPGYPLVLGLSFGPEKAQKNGITGPPQFVD